ncbi:MAG: GTP-binding protein [Fimbriiglobus sp.]
MSETLTKARYIMVGGFLGAGKTTALLRLAEWLQARGQRVGLITNDQSVGLVDTTMLESHNLAVEEITGGCFCCRFHSLTDAAEKLSASDQPDVFLAEPVGSCTDLAATVSYPLRRMYGDRFTIAPYSVLLDPTRAERILGLAPGSSFSKKVRYIYQKQLEEAEIIVINKVDLLDEVRLTRLKTALATAYPQAQVLTISAREGTNFEAWAEQISSTEMVSRLAMEVDYDTYAEGEALLGWVNATVSLHADIPFDGNRYLLDLMSRVRTILGASEIAHLKMTLSPDEGNDLGVVNLVRSDSQAEASHALYESLESGELIINLRAEADPVVLQTAIEAALVGLNEVQADIEHLEAFRPGRPVPTHRLTEV